MPVLHSFFIAAFEARKRAIRPPVPAEKWVNGYTPLTPVLSVKLNYGSISKLDST